MIHTTHRFHGRSSLRYVYQRGQTVRGSLVSLRYIHNDRQPSYRVAVVVSRKVSKSAVVRNRIRRRLYEIVRKNAAQIAGSYDIVLTVYGEDAAKLSHATLQRVVLDELRRAKVVHGVVVPEAEHAIVDEKESNT